MKMYSALSIVAPAGRLIANGSKTLEIRSWRPEVLPLKDLVIVENHQFLMHEGEEGEGNAVAFADVTGVHAWGEDEIEPAEAAYWAEGYWAWELENIRPIEPPKPVPAKRKIYLIELDHP